MELNTISLGDFVKLAEVLWQKGADSVPNVMRNSGLFKVINIPANSGNTREFSEIDLDEYAKYKGEGDQAQRAKVQQGYTKIMTKKRVALDIGITYEMRKENKYQDVVEKLTNLAPTAYNRIDLDLAHRITFATASSYTDMDGKTVDVTLGDGLPLAYSAHTVKGSSVTYRNRLANNPRLSRGALQAMRRLCVEETVDQFGKKKTMQFDILWTTDDPEDIDMAKELLRSPSNPDAVNEGVVNAVQGMFRHVVLPRVATDANGNVDTTKRHYWGLAASKYSTAYLGIWEEPHLKTPSTGNNGEDFATDDWNFGVRAGYGICIVSGAWFKFSSGDGVA